MAELLIGSLAYGALKLTSSLISAGFRRLFDVDEDDASMSAMAELAEWSGEVVLKAREKSRQASIVPPESHHHEMSGVADLGSDLRADLGAMGAAATAGLAGVQSEVHAVQHDLASVRAIVEDCRAENMAFFESFTANLEASRRGIGAVRNGPLQVAEMSLHNFKASGGEVRFLETAQIKAETALVLGDSLDVKLSAAVIVIAAGYVCMSKTRSPSLAKDFTVNGTLSNIIRVLAPTWADPSATATADGKTVLTFLLNLVTCVCVLPPESMPVFPELDRRLFPVFGSLCAADVELRRIYPEVAGVAVRAMLEGKSLRGLFQLADEVGVDVEACTCMDAVVQALLASGKNLVPGPATRRVVPAVQAAPVPVREATMNRAVLEEVFNGTRGPFWKNSAGWGTSAPLGEWHGVTLGGKARLVKLELRGNNLTGVVPPGLEGLTAMTFLSLADNQLTGLIPMGLGKLTALQYLELDNNRLSGPIPSALGNLTALKTLNLFNNRLTGPIPSELGRLTNLKQLALFDNVLSGAIPPELGALKSLTLLSLTNNKLTGPIPPELGNLTALITLNLFNNDLNGAIPLELGRLTALEYLSLRDNQLSGAIPPELGGLKSLTKLYVYNNNLTGSIPATLDGLTALETMRFDSNQLSGSIPTTLGNLRALTNLLLFNNQLTGPIPPELGRLTALQQLALYDNELSGPIPPELGGLPSLTYLGLHNNMLIGSIPTALGRLTALHKLTLRDNQLTGTIPTALSGLTALKQLWLNGNNLSGSKAEVQRMVPNCSKVYF